MQERTHTAGSIRQFNRIANILLIPPFLQIFIERRKVREGAEVILAKDHEISNTPSKHPIHELTSLVRECEDER